MVLAFCFAIPCLVGIQFVLIGKLHLAELVLLGMFPFLVTPRRLRGFARSQRIFLLLGGLWLASAAVSDAYCQSAFRDYSRGLSKILVFLALFCVLASLLKNDRRRTMAFFAGILAGLAIRYFWFPLEIQSGQTATNWWKFGLGPTVTGAAVLTACLPALRVHPFTRASLPALMAVANLFLGFRSLGLVCAATSWYILLQAGYAGAQRLRRAGSPVVLALVTGLAVLAFQTAYSLSLESRWAGYSLRDAYERQSGDYGILVGGRPTLYAGVRAIADSPFIGHGSWARDPKYKEEMLELTKHGYRVLLPADDTIPAHSHLVGAWVESGLLGGVFWCWILYIICRVLARLYRRPDHLTPAVAYIAFTMLWDIVLSPFGFERRMYNAFFLTVLLSYHDQLYPRPRAAAEEDADAGVARGGD